MVPSTHLMTSQSSRVFLCNYACDVTSVTHAQTHTHSSKIKVLIAYAYCCDILLLLRYKGLNCLTVDKLHQILLNMYKALLTEPSHICVPHLACTTFVFPPRMHQSIMSWPSQCLYGNQLEAHSSVAGHLLQ